jgi:hypothetical protein
MLKSKTINLLLLVAVAPMLLAVNPEPTFYNQLQQEIAANNVQPGTSLLPETYPPENLRPEGIQGTVYWPNRTPADYSWVYAQATDNEDIKAWVHTYWSIYTAYYVHSVNIPYHQIAYGHKYYLKALRWIPKEHSETPPITQPGPFPPPEWATGAVFSPTYESSVYDPNHRQVFVDLCLSRDAISW